MPLVKITEIETEHDGTRHGQIVKNSGEHRVNMIRKFRTIKREIRSQGGVQGKIKIFFKYAHTETESRKSTPLIRLVSPVGEINKQKQCPYKNSEQ
ncbi:hypothetical protein ANACAC_02649 [Anaerostipes caccae L1-92]|uniref:Uncharacterized protein n=1 Tax=Anaerostipes caccae (strain DSM 14662 / CCUG 47493 / JCM 13470 / NCIMB 13811 / L1-92) TaxID=411490 RepID=B0MGD8_ANACD|nr:hypothetical protein ANACAC_02649 [Anaerostipes caccae L1-92]